MSDRMDDVLSSIDEALAGADEDWTVSGDAMRWAPPGEPRELPKRIRWCPEIANPAAPTVAELDDGIDLTDQIAEGSFTYEPRRTVTVRMTVDTRRLVESMGRAAESMRELEAALARIPASIRERNSFLAMTGEAVNLYRRYYPEDEEQAEPYVAEEFWQRALESRRNRNTGPQRSDNRRWRNT